MKIDLSKFVKKQGPVLATKSCGGRFGCGGGDPRPNRPNRPDPRPNPCGRGGCGGRD